MKWMGAVWETFKNTLMLGWLILKNGFLSMVEALVSAWYWFENKVGMISDEQYKTNMTQIESEKKARLAAIHETYDALRRSAGDVANGPGWKLSWDNEGGNQAPASVNPKQTQTQMMQHLFLGGKQTAEITIKDQTGMASVTKNPNGIPIKVTPTTGQFGGTADLGKFMER